MEEYRNKVINLHAIYSRLLANLLVKLARMNPRCMGAMGGPTPYEPLAAVSRPPLLSQGHVPLQRFPDGFLPLGAMGTMGQGPKAHGPLLGGGEIHSREGSHRGVGIPLFPTYILPDGPPYRGSRGAFPRALGSITTHYITDFYRFFGLSWEDFV
jgi:hypothetical protein